MKFCKEKTIYIKVFYIEMATTFLLRIISSTGLYIHVWNFKKLFGTRNFFGFFAKPKNAQNQKLISNSVSPIHLFQV